MDITEKCEEDTVRLFQKVIMLATAILLVSSFFGTAAAEDVPIVLLDFEDGSMSAMEALEGYYAVGDVSVVADGADSSSYCMKISGSDVGNGAIINGLQSGTWYILTFSARTDSIVGEAYPNVGVNHYDGEIYQAVDRFTAQWTDYTILFRTSEDSTSVQFYTWIFKNGASAEADLYLDNVTLREKPQTTVLSDFDNRNLLGAGWDFEADDLTLLGDPSGTVDDGDKYYASTGALQIIEDSGSGTGSRCLLITGGEVGNGVRQGGLKPDTCYVLSFYAKAEAISGTATPIVGVKEYGVYGEEKVETILTGKWDKYQCVFRTGKNAENTSVYFFTWIVSDTDGAAARLYIDDVFLTEVDEAVLAAQDETQEAVKAPSETADEHAVVLQSFTGNPRSKWVIPLLIICAAEAAAIVLLIVIQKKKKNAVSSAAKTDGKANEHE